jgi:hypothetical protein
MPILDQLVAEMIGVSLPNSPTVDQRVAIAQRLATAIRRQGAANLEVLQRIQAELARHDINRQLIRIFRRHSLVLPPRGERYRREAFHSRTPAALTPGANRPHTT